MPNDELRRLPSTIFRKEYTRLREAVVVEVHGHPMGIWIPMPLSVTWETAWRAATADSPPLVVVAGDSDTSSHPG